MKFTPPQRVGLGLSLATVIALVPGMLSFAPAEAVLLPPGTSVKVSDANIKAECRFSATGADYSASRVFGKLSLKARPATLSAAGNIVHAQVACSLRGQIGQLAFISQERGSGFLSLSQSVIVPLRSAYQVCIDIDYTLRNGSTTTRSSCST